MVGTLVCVSFTWLDTLLQLLIYRQEARKNSTLVNDIGTNEQPTKQIHRN